MAPRSSIIRVGDKVTVSGNRGPSPGPAYIVDRVLPGNRARVVCPETGSKIVAGIRSVSLVVSSSAPQPAIEHDALTTGSLASTLDSILPDIAQEYGMTILSLLQEKDQAVVAAFDGASGDYGFHGGRLTFHERDLRDFPGTTEDYIRMVITDSTGVSIS